MLTQFLTISELMEINNASDKDKAIKFLITENQRLSSVIRDYEISLNQCKNALEGNTFKEPAKFQTP